MRNVNTSSKSKEQPQGLTFRWYLLSSKAQQQLLRATFRQCLLNVAAVLLIAFIFTGCSIKPEPVYKEVLTPIRCQAKMPVKPVNDGSFEAHKNKMIYYLRCESTLKYCLGLSQLKGDKDAKH
ncbi:hypothetical protein [Campylobacter ureolyticus]|uniref:hypothetical protein n=1 Tax=Campylobacter ureolyticus TaxID=827 RepID=UPI0026E99DB7|nr:hypothetical protein [Campylobacter ureolyticus]